MRPDRGGSFSDGATGRAVVYCIVPAELAGTLHEPLRAHFREDPGVEVIVERRRGDRRRGEDRRQPGAESPDRERRRIRNRGGRRVGERRATAVPVDPPPLPRRAARYTDRIWFLERVEPSTTYQEDLDTARLVTRIQSGARDEFSALYLRYFDRVYGYLRVALKDVHEAEDLAQQVFVKVIEALPQYELRAQPFRAWLFTIARHQTISHLERRSRVELAPERPERAPGGGAEGHEARTLEWITDPDLLLLMERLPATQRQVLALRFLLDLSTKETARILGRTPNDVSALQHRAMVFLRKRLTALGRSPQHRGDARMRAWLKPAQVLRRRRSALTPL